jgi:TolB-like protein/tetratricopeptide (TPR) repeat protein
MSAEVFISYASQDRERILDLVNRLDTAGVSVWIDQMSIEGATMWSQEIVSAIRNCKVLILAISENSADSENVVKEVALASEGRKRILPVYLASAEIPESMAYQLAGIQRVEFFEGDEEAGQQSVIRALAKLGVTVNEEASSAAAGAPKRLTHGSAHPSSSQAPKREGAGWGKIAAAVAGLAVLVVGAFLLGGSGQAPPEDAALGQAQASNTTNTPAQTPPLAKPVTLDTNRVVVLPFKVIGASKESEDLGYGLVSTLTSKLQPLDNLTVIANESALKFKDSTQSPNEIGQVLRVGTIVTGTIQTGGGKVQISIRSIDSNTEEVGWSGVFDNGVDQFIDLQNQIATELATELKGGLAAAETQQLAQKATSNPAAQEQYLAGRREWNKRSEEGFENAITHFDKAIELDPDYADPYSGLADTYSLMVFYKNAVTDVAMPKAKQYAETAMQKNPNLAKAYTSMGWILHMYEYDWVGAEKNFKKGVELNPNYATGTQWYGFLLNNMGKTEEALRIVERAEQSDPTSLIIKVNLARYNVLLGNKDLAMKYVDEVLAVSPTFGPAMGVKYVQLLAVGVDGGIKKYNELLSANKINNFGRTDLFQLYLKSGNREAALEQFSEIVGEPKTTKEQCGNMAMMYFDLGKIDLANVWLEKAIKNRESALWGVAVDKEYAEWQKDPKFIELMKSVNHPSYVDK